MKNKVITFLIGFLPLIIFILLWEFTFSLSTRTKFLFSSPSLVLQSFSDNIKNGILIYDTYITGVETVSGLLIGNSAGALIGLLLWYSKKIAIVSRPYIIAIGSIPIFAVAPMMIIWFGTGLFAKIMMATISTITIAITQSYEGARNVDDQQVRLLKSFGASNNQIFFKLVLPSSIVWLFNSIKLSVLFALLGAFIGEFISSEIGLGHRILKAGGLYDIALVLASLVNMILLSFFFLFLIYLAEKKIMKWK